MLMESSKPLEVERLNKDKVMGVNGKFKAFGSGETEQRDYRHI